MIDKSLVFPVVFEGRLRSGVAPRPTVGEIKKGRKVEQIYSGTFSF